MTPTGRGFQAATLEAPDQCAPAEYELATQILRRGSGRDLLLAGRNEKSPDLHPGEIRKCPASTRELRVGPYQHRISGFLPHGKVRGGLGYLDVRGERGAFLATRRQSARKNKCQEYSSGSHVFTVSKV